MSALLFSLFQLYLCVPQIQASEANGDEVVPAAHC